MGLKRSQEVVGEKRDGEEGGGSLKKVKTSRLIVKNLPKQASEDELLKHLGRLVNFPVTDCRIVRKESSDSRMFGFIGFKSIDEASKAYAVLNMSFLGTNRLNVDYALQEGDSNLSRPWSKLTQQKKASVKKSSETTAIIESKKELVVNSEGVSRLRVLNIPFNATSEEFEDFLSSHKIKYDKVTLVKESDSENNRGFGFINFNGPNETEAAVNELQGTIFQGRVLRFELAQPMVREQDLSATTVTKICGTRKRELNEAKRKIEEKKRQRHENYSSWNLLYVSANASVDTVAQTLNISKEDIYGLTSTDDSIAARTAITETIMVSETKKWLQSENLLESMFDASGTSIISSSFVATERSNDTLIIKHLGPWADRQELRDLFRQFGLLSRFSIAPSNLVAVVTFMNPQDARNAFKSLLLSKYRSHPLFLEWAPKPQELENQPASSVVTSTTTTTTTGQTSPTQFQTDVTESDVEVAATTAPKDDEEIVEEKKKQKKILIKNLPFQANSKDLRQLFEICGNIVSVRIPKKADGSNRGFAFIQFSTTTETEMALLNMTNVHLFGRHLVLMESND